MKKLLLLGLLLMSGLAARTTESELLSVQLEQAVIGGSIKLPAEMPADWRAYAISLGPRTPGHEQWATPGRVVWALRGTEKNRVVVAEIKADDLIVWSPAVLTGKGWTVSVEQALPATVVLAPTKPPMTDVDFTAIVKRSAVGDIVSLPTARPAGWVEVRLQTAIKPWLPGYVGALACEAEGLRVPFVVATVGEDDDGQYEALAWMCQADTAQLPGRSWREVQRGVGREMQANPLPLPTKAQLEEAVKLMAAQKQPAISQPDMSHDWLYPSDQLVRLPLGARIADLPAGLDTARPPVGWTALRLGGFKPDQLDRLAPGVISELVDQTGQLVPVRGVVVAVDQANRMIRFWAVSRPDSKVSWELRLP